ncbi:Transcriptional regulator containing PAS, AAA-type ATPase, and DNA-binding Fis domains [Desulfotomaculum arcticum]|uniref:Transcriptional regulator containing PAS, AAA-type ATPase, and DNA-binding Fis domains n=1 Tax=Desulfotruncus arcticus DSM 17038 TaxID=1121424 RepID=A0A1I2WIW4_9FIRM|nr:sigma 54-interacting transcriptional regulator [Desulfotruncus arcticus]SFH00567.1 Transcriptional regulator containing PAS, AAA-type ATPase, and DNA-binding Fis domains [Desulfotomaculum arcticum] [Desulfotruncus arcticus DSM 17038]
MTDVKIGVISTYQELSGYINKIAGEMMLDLQIKEGILEEGVSLAYQFEHQGVDVIISRGVTGQKIKKAISVPVVLIEITSFDILQAFYAAKKMGQKIAFLGHRKQDFCPDFETITKILDIEVDCYPYSDSFEMEEQASKMLRSDADVIVSTGLCIYKMAKGAGINAVLVKSGYDAIYSSMKRAIELVHGIRRNQERTKRFSSVLEASNDGILIIDEFNRISFINPAAQNLLETDVSQFIGKNVEELRQSSVLGNLFNGTEGEEAFKEIGRKQFWVSSMPLSVDDKEKDLLILFQSADRIQVMEQNLRRQLFKKGLYAKHTFDDIIGRSQVLKDTIKSAKKFAAANATVLIGGESGTGKELFAQSIHNASDRRKAPFVAINCAALPENLLESELFGYEEGAFTGAKKGGKIGLFEMAHGGTIFLDEIGEMTLPVQARLLRVLQEREIMRLGSDRVIPVDVRIIAATNYELYQIVAEGNFRSDLYHRLEVLNLDIPPLRVRKEDIDLLADQFIKVFVFEEKKHVHGLSESALGKLKKYDWPGNIRELQNVIHKYVLLSEPNQNCDSLVDKLINEKIRKIYKVRTDDENLITLKIGKLEDMEMQVIEYLLSTGASIKEISELIGASRTTLWRKFKTLDKAVIR